MQQQTDKIQFLQHTAIISNSAGSLGQGDQQKFEMGRELS